MVFRGAAADKPAGVYRSKERFDAVMLTASGGVSQRALGASFGAAAEVWAYIKEALPQELQTILRWYARARAMAASVTPTECIEMELEELHAGSA